MAIMYGGRAPYAPAPTIKRVIDRHRAVGLPKVDIDTLIRVQVSEALAPRTLAALTLLGFYNDDGTVTSEFDNLRRLSDAEFPIALGDMLRQAYAPVLDTIGDPATAPQDAIEAAFRGFNPIGQVRRMVQCFTGLMIYAGIMPSDALKKPGPARPLSGVPGRPAQGKPLVRNNDGKRLVRRVQAADPKPRDPEPSSKTLTEMQAAYFALLLKKAEASEGVDVNLLDRIERLVGIAPGVVADKKED